MKKQKLINIITLLSLLCCVFLLFFWPISCDFDFGDKNENPQPDFQIESSAFHITAFSGKISFHNGKLPYVGGIVVMLDDKGHPNPILLKETVWNLPGLYYRYFRFEKDTIFGDDLIWTLTMSFAYPVILTALMPVIACIRLLRKSAKPKADSSD